MGLRVAVWSAQQAAGDREGLPGSNAIRGNLEITVKATLDT
jgi:hypothetical protein